MIGAVVAAHGNLAKDLVAAAEQIVGKIEKLAIVCQFTNDKQKDIERNIVKAVESVDSPEGVLILVDVFGGSSSNIGMSLKNKNNKLMIVTGVNLPMLMDLAVHRKESNIQKLADRIANTGRKSVFTAKDYLDKRKIEVINI
ncbi:MAG: PTS sugar transporter subunit IIA [Candidatus Aureabacteria bacterium]|nr:PTS sugar transporter subunit IIA [Candidatus Auribacterota bacterium]